MRYSFNLFVIFIALMGVWVNTQNKDFCEMYVQNNNQIDFGFDPKSLSILVIGSDYWVYVGNTGLFETNSRRLPNGFDSECQTLFCVKDCDSKSGSLGCLKVIQFIFSIISFVNYNESIHFSPGTHRMADKS